MEWNKIKGTTYQLVDDNKIVGTLVVQKGMARCKILDEDLLIYRKGFMKHIIAMTNMSGKNIISTQMLISMGRHYKINYQQHKSFNLEFEQKPFTRFKITDELKNDFLSYQIDPKSEMNLKITQSNTSQNEKIYKFAFFLWYLMMPFLFEKN